MGNESLAFATYESPAGAGALLLSGERVRRHWWGDSRAVLIEEAKAIGPNLVYKPLPDFLRSALQDYFAGSGENLSAWPIGLTGTTDFALRVYDAVRRLKWGETAAYSEIARQIGSPRAARAVGGALGSNPVPLFVPCHRVVGVGSEGGWSGPPGLKRYLLCLEKGVRD